MDTTDPILRVSVVSTAASRLAQATGQVPTLATV
jgi:hypothetical protein